VDPTRWLCSSEPCSPIVGLFRCVKCQNPAHFCSAWDPETLAERPFDQEALRKSFESADERSGVGR